jgi:hypothetical protein
VECLDKFVVRRKQLLDLLDLGKIGSKTIELLTAGFKSYLKQNELF